MEYEENPEKLLHIIIHSQIGLKIAASINTILQAKTRPTLSPSGCICAPPLSDPIFIRVIEGSISEKKIVANPIAYS